MIQLTEGQKAPAFSGKDHRGNPISLKDFKGRKLVLYFYPQDDTPTCTEQACNLRDHFQLLSKHDITVLGVSPDDAVSHGKFAQKYQLPFPLIADPAHKIILKYGVWTEKQMFGRKYMGVQRASFLINEKGVIFRIIQRPKVRQHAEEIIQAWNPK